MCNCVIPEPLFGTWYVVDEIMKIPEMHTTVHSIARQEPFAPESFEEGVLIQASFGDGANPEWLYNEAQEAIAKLGDAPNFVPILEHCVVDCVRCGGKEMLIRTEPFGSVASASKGGYVMPESEVIFLGRQICSALELCAGQGISHIGINPECIYVSDAGCYKLENIAVIALREKARAGECANDFSAPEAAGTQQRGERADVYSLGLTMYYLLNRNRLPFEDRDCDDASNVQRKDGERFPDLRWVDGELSRIVLKACAHKPEDRYANAAEMRNSLEMLQFAGNISNGGLLAVYGDWVYHTSGNCHGSGYRTKKTRIDGSGSEVLCDDDLCFINVVDNHVYCSNIDDGFKIYKMNSDGSGKHKLSEEDSSYVSVVDGWIYYSNMSDGGKLYRMLTDGSVRERLNDDKCDCVSVAGAWAYYCNMSNSGSLYRIRTDGSCREKLNMDYSMFVNVYDDFVYYVNWSDGRKLFRLRKDGSGRQKLTDHEVGSFNVAYGWVFYSNASDNGRLYKMPADGGVGQKLSDEGCSFIYIVDDWIHFCRSRDNRALRIRMDGTDEGETGCLGGAYNT